jgi:hypothetical protein
VRVFVLKHNASCHRRLAYLLANVDFAQLMRNARLVPASLVASVVVALLPILVSNRAVLHSVLPVLVCAQFALKLNVK